MEKRTATCCCGAAWIEVEGDPQIHGICHCGNCKRRTGSAFGMSAYFADTQVRAKGGELKLYAIAGGNAQERFFCVACGTTVFWRSGHFPGMTGIASGCITGAPLPEPTVTLCNEGRFSWLELPVHWRTSLE